DTGLRNNLGLSLALAGNSADAIDVLHQLTESPDASVRNRQNLALAYGLAGDAGRASAIAQRDLPAEAIRGNLAYYEKLRSGKVPLSSLVAVDVAAPAPPAMALATVPAAPSRPQLAGATDATVPAAVTQTAAVVQTGTRTAPSAAPPTAPVIASAADVRAA